MVWDFLVDHWCFLPYLALLAFLAVMAVWERTPAQRLATTGNQGNRRGVLPWFRWVGKTGQRISASADQ